MTGLRLAVVAAATACGLMTGAGTLSAQEDGGLDSVARFVSEARFDSARNALELWWNTERTDAGRRDRERGLWLRGLLTVDPTMAEADFLRIVVEHPGGTYADDALVRLARISESTFDYEAAIGYLETLVRNHPASPYRADARATIDRLRESPPPAAMADTPAPEPTPPVSSAPSATLAPAPAPASARPVYTIQLGAFSTESRAYTLAATADDMGVEVRLARLPGSEMVHVRAGSFETRAEADAFAREVQLTGLSAVVFDDAGVEEPILSGAPD